MSGVKSLSERRKDEILTLLLGLDDPNSPVTIAGAYIVREIAAIRCGAEKPPIQKDGWVEWHDPDCECRDCVCQAAEAVRILHRGGDLPAVLCGDGCMQWYKNGQLHRDVDLPALVEYKMKRWYKNGQLHRDGDLPAVVYPDGSCAWFREGKFVRDDIKWRTRR